MHYLFSKGPAEHRTHDLQFQAPADSRQSRLLVPCYLRAGRCPVSLLRTASHQLQWLKVLLGIYSQETVNECSQIVTEGAGRESPSCCHWGNQRGEAADAETCSKR